MLASCLFLAIESEANEQTKAIWSTSTLYSGVGNQATCSSGTQITLRVKMCVCVCVCVFAGGLCCLDGGLDFSIGIVVQAGLRTIACAWFLSAAIAV